MKWRGDTVNTVTQGGIVGSFRDYRYGNDAHWIFMRLGEQLMREEFGSQQAQIVFRVKPAADGPDYREQFLREIAPRWIRTIYLLPMRNLTRKCRHSLK